MEELYKLQRLSTIQKRERLNDVYAVDEVGPGGAYHHYMIKENDENQSPQDFHCEIKLQKGARKEVESQHGVIDSDLLEIVRHRLQCFQDGAFASEYNAKALEHLEIALMYMNRRVEDRIERNVLGTYEK